MLLEYLEYYHQGYRLLVAINGIDTEVPAFAAMSGPPLVGQDPADQIHQYCGSALIARGTPSNRVKLVNVDPHSWNW